MSNLLIANKDYMDLRVIDVGQDGKTEWGYRSGLFTWLSRPTLSFRNAPRTESIGASDAAALMGLNKYRSPDRLYDIKVGNAPEDEDNELMAQGRQQEAGVGYWYAQRMCHLGKMEFTYPGTTYLGDGGMGWVSATPDALVRQNGEIFGLEIKTASEYRDSEFGTEFTEDIPLEYYMQCQWSMFVFCLDRWDLAVRVGGNKVRVYTILKSNETISEMLSIAERMWVDHIQKKIPPPASGHEKYTETFKDRNPSTSSEMIDADGSDQALWDSLCAAQVELDRAKHDYNKTKNTFMERIGPHKGVEGKDWRVTISRYPSKSTKWSVVARDAGASPELINRHTKTSEVCKFNKSNKKTKPKKGGK